MALLGVPIWLVVAHSPRPCHHVGDSEPNREYSASRSAGHFVVAADVATSADFYTRVLGGTTVMEGPPAIVGLANSWIIINGRPTTSRRRSELPDDPNRVSAFLTIRAADIHQVYADWSGRGGTFLTPPIDRSPEIRCYLRDPDGHLIEVGKAIGAPASDGG